MENHLKELTGAKLSQYPASDGRGRTGKREKACPDREEIQAEE